MRRIGLYFSELGMQLTNEYCPLYSSLTRVRDPGLCCRDTRTRPDQTRGNIALLTFILSHSPFASAETLISFSLLSSHIHFSQLSCDCTSPYGVISPSFYSFLFYSTLFHFDEMQANTLVFGSNPSNSVTLQYGQ